MCEEATSTESGLLEERYRYITHVTHTHTHIQGKYERREQKERSRTMQSTKQRGL